MGTLAVTFQSDLRYTQKQNCEQNHRSRNSISGSKPRVNPLHSVKTVSQLEMRGGEGRLCAKPSSMLNELESHPALTFIDLQYKRNPKCGAALGQLCVAACGHKKPNIACPISRPSCNQKQNEGVNTVLFVPPNVATASRWEPPASIRSPIANRTFTSTTPVIKQRSPR